MVEVFLMVLRLLTQEQGDNRFLKVAQPVGNPVPHCLCRRLGYDDQHFHGIILFHGLNHIHHGNSAYFSGQIPAAGADGVFNALSQTVYDGGQLLDAGA